MKIEQTRDSLSAVMQKYDIESYAAAINTIVPVVFFVEAANIVAHHRPKDIPKNFEPLNMALSWDDNELIHEARADFGLLRSKYTDDREALQDIDKADPNSKYNINDRALLKALQTENTPEIVRLRQWFQEYDAQ